MKYKPWIGITIVLASSALLVVAKFLWGLDGELAGVLSWAVMVLVVCWATGAPGNCKREEE